MIATMIGVLAVSPRRRCSCAELFRSALSRRSTRTTKSMNGSTVQKRSIAIRDRKTSVTLESEFWDALKEIAALQRTRVSELVATIDAGRGPAVNLSSAIRVFLLQHYRRVGGG